MYWGMARTGAAPAAEAPAGRWPRAWVAGDRKETLLIKQILPGIKYSVMLGNNFAVLRYYTAWRKNNVMFSINVMLPCLFEIQPCSLH